MILFFPTEPNRPVKPPIVEVYPPSPKQCRSHNRKLKTLVCVASGFYPDHVSVSWRIDGSDVSAGVASDTAAVWKGDSYQITSSLSVPLKDWFTPGKNFSCSVGFFDGLHTLNITGWAAGAESTVASLQALKHTTELIQLINVCVCFCSCQIQELQL